MQADLDFADRLEIFFGDASDAVARVYARLAGNESHEGFVLRGRLIGPRCLYAETLPAAHPFIDRGTGASLLAEAIVPEPCFWTPDMPHQYEALVELVRGGNVVARAQRLVGIRTLGAHGRKLIYDGKRWVLRGVLTHEAPPTQLGQWREAGAAMVVRNPDDALCREASNVGVLLVAELAASEVQEIRRLCRWPAVAIAALELGSAMTPPLRAGNLLLAQYLAPGRPLVAEPWAPLTLGEIDQVDDFAGRISSALTAVIAVRPAGTLASVDAGRSLCDHLQRDLARRCEVAGYIV